MKPVPPVTSARRSATAAAAFPDATVRSTSAGGREGLHPVTQLDLDLLE